MNEEAIKAAKAAASAFGKMGGKANAEKHGRKHFSKIGKKGAEARWGKKEDPENTGKPLDKEKK